MNRKFMTVVFALLTLSSSLLIAQSRYREYWEGVSSKHGTGLRASKVEGEESKWAAHLFYAVPSKASDGRPENLETKILLSEESVQCVMAIFEDGVPSAADSKNLDAEDAGPKK